MLCKNPKTVGARAASPFYGEIREIMIKTADAEIIAAASISLTLRVKSMSFPRL
jgi:hypothetical protein